MPTYRNPNKTGQTGVYQTGSPNYVELAAGSALSRMVTFTAKAADDSWANGDYVGVLIEKDASNYKVWQGTWDAGSTRVNVVVEEETVGTISAGDGVSVIAVLTGKNFDQIGNRTVANTVTGTTYSLIVDDSGKVVRFTSASPVTVTLTATLPVGFQCLLVQVGTGLVTCQRDSTDTLNGLTNAIPLTGQYRSGYLYQPIEGIWELMA